MVDNIIYNTGIVNKDFKGTRIDKYLSISFPDISRSQIQRIISLGNVTCDDVSITGNSYKVKEGESYSMVLPELEEAKPKAQNIELEFVYEDEDLAVVNKKAGMVVHPGAGVYDGTMVNALLYHCKDLSGIGGVKRPGIVHRIDKETSGLLVVAKNDNAHRFLSEQFAEHSIKRMYHAFCFGALNPIAGTIEGDIGRSPYNRKKMAIVSKNGKHAVTHYQTVANFKNIVSEVKCVLETGRTHQIRVHLSSKGNNLLGDKLYTKAKKIIDKNIDEKTLDLINNFPRQALHAQSLGFIHPKSKKEMYFEAQLPQDMVELAEALKNI